MSANIHPSIAALVRSLNASFARIEQGCDPPSGHYNEEHITIALLAYARRYVEVSMLNDLLRECRRDGEAARQDMLKRQDAAATRIAATVRQFREQIITEGAVPANLAEDLDAAIRYPMLVDRAERARRWLQQVASSAAGYSWSPPARVLLDDYQKAQHESVTAERGWDMLVRARPWLGAEMVDAFANSPERQADVRQARFQWSSVQKIAASLKLRHADVGSAEVPWHAVDGSAQLFLFVSLFHDWVIGQLLGTVMVENVLHQFKSRVERFEWQSYLDTIRRRKRGNKDELEFRDRLCLYLHDRGLDPWSEVAMGTGRADGVVRSTELDQGVRVTFEVKCVRPEDSTAAITKRLRSGASQAARYSSALNQPRAFVVVFWANKADPDIDPAWAERSPPVHFVVIDVRRAPSVAGRGSSVRVSPPTRR